MTNFDGNMNAAQTRLGDRWNTCDHHVCSDRARHLLTDWIISRYMRDIAGKYTVDIVDADPYSSDAELRCRVTSTGRIEALRWTPKDCEQHFLSPEIGQLYQIWHDTVHHAEQPLDFGVEGERQAMLQMKRDLIEFAAERGYQGECVKEAVAVLVSHTFSRVCGILRLLETDGDLTNYKHRILCLRHSK